MRFVKKVVIEDLNINIHDILCMCTKFPYETLISEFPGLRN